MFLLGLYRTTLTICYEDKWINKIKEKLGSKDIQILVSKTTK